MRDKKFWNSKQKIVYEWLEELDHPEEGITFLYVVGTNGKGSVGRALALALEGLTGQKVGHFLSPHIHKYNERIMIGKEAISDEKLEAIKDKMALAAEKKGLEYQGYFINSFIEAMLAFKGLKLAVIEAGIGALEDVTNILPFSFQVLTKMGLDHTNILGNTLKDIAFQKASSLPAHTPAVSCNQDEEAKDEIEVLAREKGSPITFSSPDSIKNLSVHIRPRGDKTDKGSAWTMSFDYEGGWLSGKYETRLVGLHQKENLATALKSMEIVFDPESGDFPDIKKYFKKRMTRSAIKDTVIEALKELYLPGRLELLSRDPYIIIDGAHNDQAIGVLKENLAWLGFSEKGAFGKPNLIFGCHDGKIHEGAKEDFYQAMNSVYMIEIQDVEDEEVKSRVERALKDSIDKDSTRPIIVAGSLYMLDLDPCPEE